jgi:hypothetical protein
MEQSLRAAERIWTPLVPSHATATNGVALTRLEDGSLLASGDNPKLTSYEVTADTPLQAITGVRLEALPDPSLPRRGPGRDGMDTSASRGSRRDSAGERTAGHAWPGRLLQDDQSRRLRVPVRAGRSSRPDEADEPQEWILGHQRDARHGAVGAARGARGRSAVRLPTGTRLTVRIDHLDGTIGQGIGRSDCR